MILLLTTLYGWIYSQSNENRYYITHYMSELSTSKKKISIWGCNSDLYWGVVSYHISPGKEGGETLYAKHTLFNSVDKKISQNVKPTEFRFYGYVGTDGWNDQSLGTDPVKYNKGDKPFSQRISGYHDNKRSCRRSLSATINITVDDPAVIEDVYFEGLSTVYACGITPAIKVAIGEYYNNGKGGIQLQVLNGNTWETIETIYPTVASGSKAPAKTTEISYARIEHYIKMGKPIRFRTVKTLLDNGYSYSTTTKLLYYLPKFEILDGTDISVVRPACKGDYPTIKIPSDGRNYTISVTNKTTGTGGNISTNNLNTIGGYYIISGEQLTPKVNFYPGEYELNIEYKSDDCISCKCPFYTTFTILNIPDFTISNPSYETYTDNRGKSYQITKRGGRTNVSFTVSNSKTQYVYIKARRNGSTYYTSSKQLLTPTSTVGDDTYYSGTTSISLYSGVYDDITVYNDIVEASRCYASYNSTFTLNQPDEIKFEKYEVTSPDCNTSNLRDGEFENGEIKITKITGGFGTLSYTIGSKKGSISGSNFSQTEIGGLTAGNYLLVITDEKGNSKTTFISIKSPPAINITITDTIPPTLSCSSDGAIRVEAAGGAGNYTYSRDYINYTDTTNFIEGYSAGDNNKVYVKDSCGCVVEKSFSLVVPNALAVDTIMTSLPTCYGGEDGSCTIIMKNVNGKLSVHTAPTDSIIISGDTISLFKLSSGKKDIRMLDTDTIDTTISCPFETAVVIPEDRTAISIEVDTVEVSDKGSNTGQINICVSGGNSGGYNVALYEDAALHEQIGTTQFTLDSCSFEGLKGESGGKPYTILVSDALGCIASRETRISEAQDTLRLSASVSRQVSCFGVSDAEIELSAEGGWGEYQYSNDSITWVTDSIFTGYSTGVYKFYVRDKWHGTNTVNIQVGQPQALNIEQDSIAHVLCNGDFGGLLRYRVSGGTYPYQLAPKTGTLSESILNGDTLITISRLKAGEYTFTVTDAMGCSITALTDTITEPERLQVSVLDIIQPTCELDNGILLAKATGGSAPYKYILENTNADFPYQQIRENVIINDTVLFYDIPNRYDQLSVTVIDNNGCEVRSSIDNFIVEYKNPFVENILVNDLVCYGEKNGRIEILSCYGTSPASSYTMYNADSTYLESNTTGVFKDLYAGNYWIYVYDTNDCRSNIPYPVIVKEPEVFAITIDTIMPVVTKGEKDGKVYFRVKGGAEGSKIVRLKTIDNICVDSISVVNNLQFNFPVRAETYYMEISDHQTCSVQTEFFEVKEPEEPLRFIVTQKEDALCKAQTGRIVVEGVGGWGEYRYKRVSEGQFSTLNRFENLYPGSYLVEVTDKMGAVYRESIVINEPLDSLRAEVTGIQNPTCNVDGNGSISIYLSGGTPPYVFYNEQDTIEYTGEGSILWQEYESGPLLFYLTDANGCRFELETLIPETSLLKIDRFEVKHPSYEDEYDGSIKAIVSGGIEPYTYSWERSFMEVLPDSTELLENIGFGYYGLTVTDAGGCSAEEVIYLAEPNDKPFEILEVGHETSFGAEDGYAVLRSDTVLADFALISPAKIIYELEKDDTTDNFHVVNDTVYLNKLEGGKWHIIGADDDGRKYVAEFTINPYPEFLISRTTLTHIASKGDSTGSIKIEIKGGGGGCTFKWTNASNEQLLSYDEENKSLIENLPAGSYTVLVEDRYGNQLTKTIEVQEPAERLTISLVDKKDQNCKDYEDAWVVVTASGGWGDYQFRHDSEIYYKNASSFNDLPTRDNYFYLIDKMGAQDSIKVLITEPEYLRASVVAVDSVKCKGNDDGSILFNITGGTPPYRFKELDGGYWIEGNHAVNRSEGWYTYIFTDNEDHNCIGQDTLTVYVPEPDSLLFREIHVTHTTCELDNGKIVVSLQGGTRPYYYSWMDYLNVEIGTDSIITDLKQNGVYTLNVTDANGCTQQFTQLINPSTLPRVLQVETTEVLCYGDTTGTARVTDFIPGIPYAPYTFTWSNGDTGDYSARFEKGTHHVTIADENGCSTTYYFEITEPAFLYLEFSEVVEPQCYGYGNGYIKTETSGGKGQYSYLWSTGATTAYIEHLFKGEYWVELTDENGCYFRKEITLGEPEYKTLDLGEDISICPGNTAVIDGQDFVSHRWFTAAGDISTQRYLDVTKEGSYFLEATDENGCPVWGDIYVSIGNHALTADLLLPSEAAAGDTLAVFELSNMELDSIEWIYDPAVFERVYVVDEYNLPYAAYFRCLRTGIYNIGLYAYANGCYSPAYKQIEVVNQGEEKPDDWGYKEPLIIALSQHPNPTDGEFTVELELREEAEVSLTLFEVASGICVNQRTINGQKKNQIEYKLVNVNKGTYALIVTAGKERRQVKIIVK